MIICIYNHGNNLFKVTARHSYKQKTHFYLFRFTGLATIQKNSLQFAFLWDILALKTGFTAKLSQLTGGNTQTWLITPNRIYKALKLWLSVRYLNTQHLLLLSYISAFCVMCISKIRILDIGINKLEFFIESC